MGTRAAWRSSTIRIASALIAIAGILLASCASTPEEEPQTPPRIGLPLVAPSTLGATRSVQQVLHAKYGDQESTLSAVLQVTPTLLQVIAMNGVGLRVFTLKYDGSRLRGETIPGLPEQIEPERVLADLQLAMWPLHALRSAAAGTQWQVDEDATTRTLKHNGKLVAEVHYETRSPWKGKLQLVNHLFGYSLDVDSKPLEEP